MRWILVFIILYLIPIRVIFKNYNTFSRACIYACTYVVLATTLVISNMYISGLQKVEQGLLATTDNYKESYVSTFRFSKVENDLKKIEYFKRDISDIEDIALNPIEKYEMYTKDISKNLDKLAEAEKDVEKSMYMCERVIEIYEDMEIPKLSADEYTEALGECVQDMKSAYELKNKAIESLYLVIKEDNTSYIPKIEKYFNKSNEKISKYNNRIACLENKLKGK